MILIGIDIGKLSHTFAAVSKETGEVLIQPTNFSNTQQGFTFFYDKFNTYKKEDVIIGMEDTGHYHFALLKDILDKHYSVALINPIVTDLTRKLQGGVNVNIKMLKKWKIKMYIFQLFFLGLCFQKGSLFSKTI